MRNGTEKSNAITPNAYTLIFQALQVCDLVIARIISINLPILGERSWGKKSVSILAYKQHVCRKKNAHDVAKQIKVFGWKMPHFFD